MVMSLIESLTRIKNAVYGREVREAIHDGVFRANQIADGADAKADNTQIRQEAVEVFNNQVIQEMTDKDVISAPEIIQARGGKPTLQARLDETTAQLTQIETNVKDFGAKGDGITDDTTAINLAIENTRVGGTVNFPEGVYMVDGFDENAWNGEGTAGIKVRKPLTINMNGGATVKQISKSERNSRLYYGYLIFEVIDTNDVIFEGKGIIEGDRKEHLGIEGDYKGEHGTGIYINNSQNVVVRDLTIKHTWGDGIGIVYDSKDVTVDNVIIDHVRRNGITLLKADNVNIINSTIKNVIGTMPQAGIDIEPNKDEGKANNVTISNCNFLNIESQDIVFGGGDGCDNIFIDKCYFETRSTSIVIVGNNPNSVATISNCVIKTANRLFIFGGFGKTYLSNITIIPDFREGTQPVAITIEERVGYIPNIYIDGLKNVDNFLIVFDVVGSDNKVILEVVNSSFSSARNRIIRSSSKNLQISMRHNVITDSDFNTSGISLEKSVFDGNHFTNFGFIASDFSSSSIINNTFNIESASNMIHLRRGGNSIISNNIFKVPLTYAITLIDMRISEADKTAGHTRIEPNILTNNTIISNEDAYVRKETEDVASNLVIRNGLLQ